MTLREKYVKIHYNGTKFKVRAQLFKANDIVS